MTNDFLKKFLDARQIEGAIDEVATLARAAGAEVALVGGVALQLYGSDRLTKDVDFVGDEAFEGLTETREVSIGGFQGKTSGGVQVDVLIGGEYPGLMDDALARARNEPGLGVRIATLEHIVAMKLVAGRAKDEEDIKTVLRLRAVDVAAAREIIAEHVGKYAVRDLNALVDEVAWREEHDSKRGQ